MALLDRACLYSHRCEVLGGKLALLSRVSERINVVALWHLLNECWGGDADPDRCESLAEQTGALMRALELVIDATEDSGAAEIIGVVAESSDGRWEVRVPLLGIRRLGLPPGRPRQYDPQLVLEYYNRTRSQLSAAASTLSAAPLWGSRRPPTQQQGEAALRTFAKAQEWNGTVCGALTVTDEAGTLLLAVVDGRDVKTLDVTWSRFSTGNFVPSDLAEKLIAAYLRQSPAHIHRTLVQARRRAK